jgi:hypothetical protein
MRASKATVDYLSSALADRKQARMDSWKNGFTLKQRNAPKALAGVPEEGHVDSERFVDLLRDSWVSEAGITSFQFNNDPNQSIRGAFRTRLCVFS